MRLAVAVDGGNSKTDLAVVDDGGALLALVRGGGSSPHQLGVVEALDRIEALLEDAAPPQRAEVAELLLAGVDFPDEERTLLDLATARGWAERTLVANDTFAVLRAGTDRGWGVGVVCGAGINCLGVAPDGRHARFPALGPITGDWGGGYDVGREALFVAARSEDGRGPRTSLERAVPAHFGLDAPSEVAHELHRNRIAHARLAELAPLVLAEAADDPVAAAIVGRLVEEVVAMVRVAIERLGLEREGVEVVLGGGLLQRAAPALVAEIAAGVRRTAPLAVVRPTDAPPILGAALLALDALDAEPAARERLRAELRERTTDPVTVGGSNG